MRGGNVAQAVEVQDEMDGEPGIEAAVHGYAVDAGCEEGCECADGEVIDDGAVRDAAFWRVKVVRC